MYIATITNKEIKQVGSGRKRLFLDVTFSNGTKTVTEQLDFPLYTTVEKIHIRLKEYAEELTAGDTLDAAISTGDVDFTGITTAQTQDEIILSDFVKNIALRKEIQHLIDWGIVPATNPRVVAVDDAIKSALQADATIITKLI